jgi:hypothetical protein
MALCVLLLGCRRALSDERFTGRIGTPQVDAVIGPGCAPLFGLVAGILKIELNQNYKIISMGVSAAS